MLNKQAFALIELIIVIAIIALMAAAVFVSVNPAKRIGESKDSKRLADLIAITKAVNLYTADNSDLPLDFSVENLKRGNKIVLCSAPQAISCDGQVHDCLVIDDDSFLGPYLTNLPIDPSSQDITNTGYYITRDIGNTVSFGACSSYGSGANLKIAGTTKAESFRGIYRSVGPSNTTALANGAANILNISGYDAIFTTALANNIGVGDVIQYDSDNDGTVDALVFIEARYSSTNYSVVDVDGNLPTQMTVSDTDWDIFRAYTSLYDAEAGTENIGIDNSLEDFDTWSGGYDLVTADKQWNIAFYGDAADTQQTNISGWTTGPENYVRIYAPYLSSEVGASQRHSGVWDASKARMEVPQGLGNKSALYTDEGYIRIDGLQIKKGPFPNYDGNTCMYLAADLGELQVSNNICWIVGDSLYDGSGVRVGPMLTATNYKIWNNIFYADATQGSGISFNHFGASTGYVYLYNNTVINFNTGISFWGLHGLAKNNITQDCGNGFYGGGYFDVGSGYNISDLASDAPGTDSKDLTTVSFVSTTTDDYHLAVGDTAAQNAGTDLSGDANIGFIKDIDGEIKNGTWDIGADEYQ